MDDSKVILKRVREIPKNGVKVIGENRKGKRWFRSPTSNWIEREKMSEMKCEARVRAVADNFLVFALPSS